jgi:hypothetical protein
VTLKQKERSLKKINFFIASEQHARVFSPVIKLTEEYSVYRCGSPRNDAIDKVLRLNGIDPQKNRVSLNSIFEDMIHKDESFVLPLMIGTKSHMMYKDKSQYSKFLNMKLGDIKGKVCLMNEMLYFTDGRNPYRYDSTKSLYTPQAHVLLARSKPEYDTLRLQAKGDTNVVLVGDPTFKRFTGKYASGVNVMLMTSFDPTRMVAATEVLDEILLHINLAIEKGMKIATIGLKPHPGEARNDYREKIKSLCRNHKIKFKEIDRWKIPEDLPGEYDISLIQSSLSSHLVLRSMGVESFIYSSDKERNEDLEFLRLADMPRCKLHNKTLGNYHSREYDKWINKTFMIDGNAARRWLDAIK